MKKQTILDIGCSEGYISCELAKAGYDVTGVEKGYIPNEEGRGRKLIAIARYLATIQNIKAKWILSDWKDLIRERDFKFDNILYLSVLHNEINALGAQVAFKNLELFRGKCKRLFVEVPDVKDQKDWMPYFKIEDICTVLERKTGMKVQEVWHGYRPIILLTNELSKTRLSKKKLRMKTITKEKVNGCKMQLLEGDEPITSSILETGQWEEGTTKFIKDNLRSGDTFIDVGASVGYYTLLASKLVGPKGKVYSFEPAKQNLDVLLRNLFDNGIKNVIVFPFALTDSTEKFKGKLYNKGIAGQGSLNGDVEDNYEEVNLTTFDAINKKENIV